MFFSQELFLSYAAVGNCAYTYVFSSYQFSPLVEFCFCRGPCMGKRCRYLYLSPLLCTEAQLRQKTSWEGIVLTKKEIKSTCTHTYEHIWTFNPVCDFPHLPWVSNTHAHTHTWGKQSHKGPTDIILWKILNGLQFGNSLENNDPFKTILGYKKWEGACLLKQSSGAIWENSDLRRYRQKTDTDNFF